MSQALERHGIDQIPYRPFEFSYRHPKPFVLGTLRIARELRSRRIDLVHCSDLMAAYQAAPAAQLARVPVVCHVRSNFPDAIPRRHTLPLASVDRFVFVSNATWRNFDRIYRVQPRKGAVIYDWAPEPSLHVQQLDRDQIRKQLGISNGVPVVGMVARIAPEKDFETLLDAFAAVRSVHPDARLVIVGSYDAPACSRYWLELRERARHLRLDDHVIWTGFQADPLVFMLAMDIVVLITHSEGFPLVLLEAMGQKRPVIATRTGGIPELIADGQTGLLHEHGDVRGLADAICRLIGDPVAARALANRAHALVRSQFVEWRTVDSVVNLYGDLMKPKVNSRLERGSAA